VEVENEPWKSGIRRSFMYGKAEKEHRVNLEKLTDLSAATDGDLLELDDALDHLAKDYAVVAEIVKLRFFAGRTFAQAGKALGLPRRTADRHWSFDRAW
jgi:DNA-directed RNA polymerase specialized sigma24 family protein